MNQPVGWSQSEWDSVGVSWWLMVGTLTGSTTGVLVVGVYGC